MRYASVQCGKGCDKATVSFIAGLNVEFHGEVGRLALLDAQRVTAIVTVLVGVVLVAGGPIEKLLVRRYGSDAEGQHPASQKRARLAYQWQDKL